MSTIRDRSDQRLISLHERHQSRQDRGIVAAVFRRLYNPNLQSLHLNTRMSFAPLPQVLCPMPHALPFAFAEELDACAVHQQVQPSTVGSVGQGQLKVGLSAAHHPGVSHRPVPLGPLQQAFHQSQSLLQCHAKHGLDTHSGRTGWSSKSIADWDSNCHCATLATAFLCPALSANFGPSAPRSTAHCSLPHNAARNCPLPLSRHAIRSPEALCATKLVKGMGLDKSNNLAKLVTVE
jgi:hypothetical protein